MLKEYQTETGDVLMVSEDGKVYHDGYELARTMRGKYLRVSFKGHSYTIHRLVASCYIQDLKRKDKKYHVHHKDENPLNNSIDNLVILTEQEHQKLHHQKYSTTKKCVVCGKEFTPHKTKRLRAKVCSPKCQAKFASAWGEKCRKPIKQYTLQGEYIKTWESMTEIENVFNCFASNICKCCKGQIKSYKGYIWKYA